MEVIKYKAYIIELGGTAEVDSIDLKNQKVVVDIANGAWDGTHYNFDEVELMRYIGMEDKNGVEMYTGMKVKYAKIKYTDCSREEIESMGEPIIGKLYFAEGIWFGIEREDETGNIFWAGSVDGEEFEVLDEKTN